MRILALAGCMMVVGAFSNDDECDLDGGVCPPESRAMFSKKHSKNIEVQAEEEEGGLAITSNVVEKQHAGYTITTVKGGYIREDGKPQWLICVPEGDCDDSTTHKMVTDCLPPHMEATFEGKPDEGGVCCAGVAGSEEEVKQELDNCKEVLPEGTTIQQDVPITIPEVFDQREVSEDETEKTTWGLDRVDDRSGLDHDFSPDGTGKGVHVFVVDTGIRTTHTDFGGRAFPAYEAVNQKVCDPKDTACADDWQGHGSHCAGTVGGIKAGVAKDVILHAVRIFHKTETSATAIIESYNFVLMQKDKRPAVVSASFGSQVPYYSKADELAIKKLAEAGVTVVAAAGNAGEWPDNPFGPWQTWQGHIISPSSPYACKGGPANIKPWVFTVGSTDPPNSMNVDKRTDFSSIDSSNPGYKPCVDIFAPGKDIMSCGHTNNTGFTLMSGTSMACPHVSGAFALLLEKNPKMSIEDQAKAARAKATKNAVTDEQGSPNLMLYVGKGVSTSTLSPKPPGQNCSDTPKCSDHLLIGAEPAYAGGNTLTCNSSHLSYWVRLNCAKTCGFCQSEPGATTAPPAETTEAPKTAGGIEKVNGVWKCTGSCDYCQPHDTLEDENVHNDMPLCVNGEFNWHCSTPKRVRRVQCPARAPIMCALKKCDGDEDYCCETDCGAPGSEQFGGPRPCEE